MKATARSNCPLVLSCRSPHVSFRSSYLAFHHLEVHCLHHVCCISYLVSSTCWQVWLPAVIKLPAHDTKKGYRAFRNWTTRLRLLRCLVTLRLYATWIYERQYLNHQWLSRLSFSRAPRPDHPLPNCSLLNRPPSRHVHFHLCFPESLTISKLSVISTNPLSNAVLNHSTHFDNTTFGLQFVADLKQSLRDSHATFRPNASKISHQHYT